MERAVPCSRCSANCLTKRQWSDDDPETKTLIFGENLGMRDMREGCSHREYEPEC